ncbi:MAG TPA: glycosyltransferase [Usitatibacter sp.]|nr:glycosyltransferase [Usitatibacter sp.]
MNTAAYAFAGLFLAFLATMHLLQLVPHLLALRALRRSVSVRSLQELPPAFSGFEPPVSLVVAAFDQEATIADTVRALLQLDYADFEIVVVNDGSNDATLAALEFAFDLEAFPKVYWRRLATRTVRAIYKSHAEPRLLVVDKEHGGRADALNAGINASHYPLFCAVDPQQMLHRDSLRRALEPFVDDPATVAVGAAIRPANGCAVAENRVTAVELPQSLLGMLQIAEYLRTYPFARLGWAEMKASLVMSGAVAVFRKDAVVESGGFKSDTGGAATELMMRLHRVMRTRKEDYSVHFVADAVSWNIVPETFGALREQHVRRQLRLAESLHANASLLGSRGTVGMLAFPGLMLFECYGPLLELAGYAAMLALFALGWLPGKALALVLVASFGLGFLVSASALLLEEYSFRLYPRAGQLARLLLASAVENLGYRQLVACWRTMGLWQWMRARLKQRAPPRRELPSHGRLRP